MNRQLRMVCFVGLFVFTLPTLAEAQFRPPLVTGEIVGLEGKRTGGPEEIRVYKANSDGKVNRANQPMGYPKFPTTDTVLNEGETPLFHNAIDISSGGKPQQFKAGVYGTVVSSQVGKIIVQTEGGNFIQYNHNSATYVKFGDNVTPDTALGLTGKVNTGQIHLHIQATNSSNRLINPDAAILQARTPPQAASIINPQPPQGNVAVIDTLKPVVRGGELKLIDSAQLYYDDNAPKIPYGAHVGDSPKTSNTGNYIKFSQTEAKAIPTSLNRTQRLQQNLQLPKALWGGIVMGSLPKSSPAIADARWTSHNDEVSLEVKTVGSDIYASYVPTNSTELWAAYNFLRPGPELVKLGAKTSDVGLLSVEQYLTGGEAEFVIHPAIANTYLAREAMRLDLVLGIQDPSFPLLPKGWTALQWYDAPGRIKILERSIIVEPVDDPRTTVLRVKFFMEKAHLDLESDTLVHLQQNVDAFRTMDRFARTLAVLNWLDAANKLPELPSHVQPNLLNVPNRWSRNDVLLGSESQAHGWLPTEEKTKSHSVFLEQGKPYRIDLESWSFDTYLVLKNKTGKTMAEDDDGGYESDSKIDFTPTQSGEYVLVVSAFKDKGRGSYRLTVRPAESNWVGKSVYPAKAGIRIGHSDAAGRETFLATLDGDPLPVLAQKNQWINVRTANGIVGWFDKSNAVLAETALDYFTELMNRDPKNSFAKQVRSQILRTPSQATAPRGQLPRNSQLEIAPSKCP